MLRTTLLLVTLASFALLLVPASQAQPLPNCTVHSANVVPIITYYPDTGDIGIAWKGPIVECDNGLTLP